MRKLLGYILLALALLVCIDVSYGTVMDYMRCRSKSGPTSLLEDICEREEYDIIIMGSSRACHHYDVNIMSDILKKRVVNAGMEGQGIITMYGILEMIAERYTPSLIIYDVTPEYDYLSYSSDDELTRYTTPLKPYVANSKVASHIKTISERERLFLYSSLYRYNSIGLTVCKDYLTSSSDDSLSGYAPLYGTMEEVVLPDNSGDISIHESKYICFRNLIQLCKNKAIPLLLVASPALGASDSGKYDGCRDIANEYQIPFYDFYADARFSTNPSLFHDQVHLNSAGAQKYTLILLSKDVATLLPDKCAEMSK